jgi:hypothetical protein
MAYNNGLLSPNYNTIYRLKIGRYPLILYPFAANLCNKIKNMPDPYDFWYQNARIKKIDGYYSIIVGLFLSKTLAEAAKDILSEYKPIIIEEVLSSI